MENSKNSTIKTYLVEKSEFTHSIGVLNARFIVSYVGEYLISGLITVDDNYLCSVDIWNNSEYVELITRESNEKEIAVIEKLFNGRWAE